MSEQPTLTLTLPAADWQLLMNICAQAMQPYVRLGEVLAAMQRQAAEAQAPNRTAQQHPDPEKLLEQARSRVREVAP